MEKGTKKLLDCIETKKNLNELELLSRIEDEINHYTEKYQEAFENNQTDRALYLEGVVKGMKMIVEPLREIYEKRNK